eukprot:361632-Chlamydomonas_euryale.AAC.6
MYTPARCAHKCPMHVTQQRTSTAPMTLQYPPKLVEEADEVVQRLEGVHACHGRARDGHVFPLGVDDDEEDKHPRKALRLEHSAPKPRLVHKVGGKVVPNKRHKRVEQRPLCLFEHRCLGVQQADEEALLELVAIEHKVVGQPRTAGNDLAWQVLLLSSRYSQRYATMPSATVAPMPYMRARTCFEPSGVSVSPDCPNIAIDTMMTAMFT